MDGNRWNWHANLWGGAASLVIVFLPYPHVFLWSTWQSLPFRQGESLFSMLKKISSDHQKLVGKKWIFSKDSDRFFLKVDFLKTIMIPFPTSLDHNVVNQFKMLASNHHFYGWDFNHPQIVGLKIRSTTIYLIMFAVLFVKTIIVGDSPVVFPLYSHYCWFNAIYPLYIYVLPHRMGPPSYKLVDNPT